jgi:hypothetical protein
MLDSSIFASGWSAARGRCDSNQVLVSRPPSLGAPPPLPAGATSIHDGKPDQGLLAYQYLQTLPKIAQGDANKMWIVPSEFSKALEGLSRLGGAEEGKSWLDVGASPNGNATPTAEIDTSGWFESQLPAAADQREAKIELSSIADVPLSTTPSLAQAKDDVRGIGNAELPPAPPPPPSRGESADQSNPGQA